MDQKDLRAMTLAVCDIAKSAGSYIREERRKFSLSQVERKHAHDYVSYVDKGSETRNPQQAVITDLADANNPSEIAPTEQEIEKHQTYTTTPRYLEIPRLKLKARVKSSTVTEYIMPVPDNIYDVDIG